MFSLLLLSLNLTSALLGAETGACAGHSHAADSHEVAMIGADKPVFLGRMVVTATALPAETR